MIPLLQVLHTEGQNRHPESHKEIQIRCLPILPKIHCTTCIPLVHVLQVKRPTIGSIVNSFFKKFLTEIKGFK